jgi:hypothetical protein
LDDVLRIFEQCALEERESALLLERGDNRDVLFLVGEARFTTEFFGQAAVERDPA